MKIQDIKTLASLKGYKTEIEWIDGQEHIGISIDAHVYHWFYCFDQSTGQVMFHSSYSCNTGKTKKGYKHKWNTYYYIERLITKHLK